MDPKNEPTRKCPVDGAGMTKRLVSDVILIDTCAQCGGIWFDKGELEVMRKKSKDAGWNEGFVIGMLF
jgi:Zn-finger nucleic acid-binding protein